MSKFNYELVDYAIADQNLSLEDVQYLLRENLVSPFSMVQRVGEGPVFPILSHPDFGDEPLSPFKVEPSVNCRRFVKELRRHLGKDSSPSISSIESKEDAQRRDGDPLTDRRRPLATVLLTLPNGEMWTGGLLRQDGNTLKVVLPSMSLKVGQSLQVLILGSQLRGRMRGTIKSVEERADRRKQGHLFFTFEIKTL